MDIMKTTTMTDQLKLTLASGVVHGLQMKLKNNVKWSPNWESRPRIKGADATLTADLFADIMNGTFDSMSTFVPIMHPISKLTEPILPDGKIPIVELANKKYGENNFDPDLVMEELELSGWHNWPTWITDQLDAWHINYRGVETVEIVND